MTLPAPVFLETAPPLTGGCRTLHLPAKADGPCLTLWINTPEADRPAQGWPAMILLDAEAYFTAAAEMAQRLARRTAKTRIEPMLIVGVSLTSPDRQATFRFPHGADPSTAPQGRQLLDRLVHDVLPLLAAEGADRARLTLMGHSMSGLFVLEARAAAAPFARYIAISPSIWANPSVINAQPRGSRSASDLFVVVGAQEETDNLPPAHLARRMVSNTLSLQENGAVTLNVLADEDHGSTPYASLPAALRFASQRLAAG